MANKNLLIQTVIFAITICVVQCAKEVTTTEVVTPDPYIEKIRPVFKAMVHNSKFKQMQPMVTKCHEDNANKFTNLINNTRAKIQKCGGKRLKEVLPLYDDIIHEADSFLAKALDTIRKIYVCNNDECVDLNMDKLSTDLKANEKLIDGKRNKILDIYEEQGDDVVKSCVIHVHSMALLDYVMVVQDIRLCLIRKILKL